METTRRLLFKLIHISDLHLASSKPLAEATNDGIIAGLIKGFRCHDPNVKRELGEYIRHERKINPEIRVALSGDLTAKGAENEFRNGINFLEGGGVLDRAKGGRRKDNSRGIRYKEWASWTIPGNHDHWPGSRWHFGQEPRPSFHDTFRNVPFWQTTWSLNETVSIRVIGIDTDADTDVNDSGKKHFWRIDNLRRLANRSLARGSFCSQLIALDEHLEKLDTSVDTSPPNEIRVLLLHHPRSYSSRWFKLYAGEIDKASKAKLDELIIKHNISILCSGHLHTPHIKKIEVEWDSKKRWVLEARCGTSMQYTEDDSSMLDERAQTLGGAFSLNTFLLHTVEERDGQIIWRAEMYYYAGEQGFQPYTFDDAFSEQRGLADELVVWPRP